MFAGMNAEEYYGPPRPGQSFAQYESYMSMKNITLGSGIIALTVINPVIGAVVGIGWLLSGPEKIKSKPTTQGG